MGGLQGGITTRMMMYFLDTPLNSGIMPTIFNQIRPDYTRYLALLKGEAYPKACASS